ncbi:MAG: hypothetical protein K2W82_03045 [Candidatus Obscuribacterales bacterium]|nr:hypothetical protein [Candidatus Obscuribacterales bacterium]
MSVEKIKGLISEKKIVCPKCKKAVQKFDKYVETMDSVWDGAGDSHTQAAGSKVTLICGNAPCSWQERSEYWENYIDE